jgi:hypothetical protein
MEVDAKAVLGELKRVRAIRGGINQVDRKKVPTLNQIATERTQHGVALHPRWRQDVVKLVADAIAAAFDNSGQRKAMQALLAVDQGSMLDAGERRTRAAAAVGYSPLYFGKSKEGDMMNDLARVISETAAEPTDGGPDLRSNIDALLAQAQGVNSDSRIAELAITCGLVPILQLASTPEHIRHDFSYNICLTAGVSEREPVYFVRSRYATRRTLITDRSTVAVCRTIDSMHRWFDSPGVIAVEYAPLSERAWRRAIADGTFVSSISANMARLPVSPPDATQDDVVVFHVDTSAVRGERARLEVSTEFVHSWNYKETTVRLRNHFCLGNFHAEIQVVGDDPINPIEIYEYISGVDDGDVTVAGRLRTGVHSAPLVANVEDGFARVSVVQTSVIWPGSGVHFSWYNGA